MTDERSRTRRYAPHAVAVAFVIAVLGIAGVPVVANPLRPATTEISVDFPRTLSTAGFTSVTVPASIPCTSTRDLG